MSLASGESISSLQISDPNEVPIEGFTSSELDQILESIPMNFLSREDDPTSNLINDLDLNLSDGQTLDDDLFVQMLLDNDSSMNFSRIESSLSDYSSSVPRITSVDEFDAFLRDFTRNFATHSQEQVNQLLF